MPDIVIAATLERVERAVEVHRTSVAAAAAVLVVAVALLLGFGSPFVRAGGAAPGSNKLVRTIQDTTVVCVTPTTSGAHAFDVFLSPKSPVLGAFIAVGSNLYSMLGVTAERQARGLWPALPSTMRGVSVNRAHCRRTSVHLPLSRGSLAGPPIRYRAIEHCILDGRIYVRARAVFDGSRFEAAVAVRLAKGELVGFARIRSNGTGALYTSGRCEVQS